MYQFPQNLKNAYEPLTIPLAFYQSENDELIPLLVSDGFCKMMCMDRGHVLKYLKGSVFERVHPDDVGKTFAEVNAFIGKQKNMDVIYRRRTEPDGEYHYMHSYGTWQTMPDGTELMCTLYLDLSESIDETLRMTEAYNLFREDNFHMDPLTDLPNLNYLNSFADEKVHSLRIQGREPVLVYADVIAMQFYNNQYGYNKGNELLCLIADILKEHFHDGLVIRGSEDHFIIIDSFTDESTLSKKMASVNEEIKNKADGNASGVKSGICVYEEDMQTLEAMNHARRALKWIGHNRTKPCYFYTHLVDDKYWDHKYIIENFDRALESGWIKIYYQLMIRVETQKAAAMEALARWVDPVRGIISPGEFIPVLEKYHLLYKLDLHMAEEACREIIVRRENGITPVPVTVNVAAQDFDYINMPEELSRIYDRYLGDETCTDFADKYLVLEITEHDMATAPERFNEQLHELKKRGFCIWLDDFGSAYSSLNVFSRFNVDLIKFDMELLRNLDDHNGANRLIMKAMTDIAKQLGIHTLAEGIETLEQKEFLDEIGCGLAQGYYYHRPEPLEATLYRFKNGQKQKPTEDPDERSRMIRKWLEE